MSTHGGTSTSAPPATTVTGPDAIGAPAVVGTGLHYARNDHDHGLPILDYNALQYQDLLGWTFDIMSSTGTLLLPTAATLYLGRIPLPSPTTITNVLIDITALGLTLTHSYLALFRSDGTIVGQSADQSTAWGSLGAAGMYTLPLVGGSYVCTPLAANDFVWAAVYVGTFATAPGIDFTNLSPYLVTRNLPAARCRVGGIVQANTATLGNIVPANIQQYNGIPYWMGIS
jgi:hypothetical protein